MLSPGGGVSLKCVLHCWLKTLVQAIHFRECFAAKRGIVIVSCLSVCPSATSMYDDNVVEVTWKVSTRIISLMSSILGDLILREHPQISVGTGPRWLFSAENLQ